MRIVGLVAIAVLLNQYYAFAQQPVAGPTFTLPPESITITATKPTQTAIKNFVETRGMPTHALTRMARWTLKVCPQTIGLGDTYAKYVTQRIRDIAAAVGAPLNTDPACQPNIEVIFTTAPQVLVDSIRKTDPAYLGFYYTNNEADNLAKVTHPIQAWYLDMSQSMYEHRAPGRGGQTIDMGRCGVAGSISFKVGGRQISLRCLTTAGGSAMHAKDGMVAGFFNILIVAEPAKLFDYEVGTLADYISMLALSEPASLDGCEELPSISNMMAPGCASAASRITNGDLAYLKALYKPAGGDLLAAQRDYIREEMYKTLVTDKGD
jgi:hypothetical protein